MQGTQHLVADSEANVAARAQALERMRLSYTCSLEKSVRMAALKAKTEATLQALQGGFTRPELSSQVHMNPLPPCLCCKIAHKVKSVG